MKTKLIIELMQHGYSQLDRRAKQEIAAPESTNSRMRVRSGWTVCVAGRRTGFHRIPRFPYTDRRITTQRGGGCYVLSSMPSRISGRFLQVL